VGLLASALVAFPSGDAQGRNVGLYQPATLAAMEMLFSNESGAPLVILGQPDIAQGKLDNPIFVPKALSFMLHRDWSAEVKGLAHFPKDQLPDNIPLLYYSFHIMVGLGTLFIGLTGLAALLLRRGTLYANKPMLWALMLAIPFPYIANTMGWITAEIGRQPWLVHGLMRTSDGSSATVSAGNALFTLLGFMGIYTVLSILFLFLAAREIEHGPERKEIPALRTASAL
jgi:cytochrome bd ubiquinol oxidase subunit I